MLEDVSIGADHLLFYPFVASGEQSPYWDPYSKTALIGLGFNKNIRHIVRAVFEGLTYAIKLNVDVFSENSINIREIVISGGGAKNISWSQMKADITALPVKIPENKDNTSLGAAMIGGLATKIYTNVGDCKKKVSKKHKALSPNIKKHERYMKYYKMFKRVYPSMHKIFRNS